MKEEQKEEILNRMDIGIDLDNKPVIKFMGLAGEHLIRLDDLKGRFDPNNHEHIAIAVTCFLVGFDICQDETSKIIEKGVNEALEILEVPADEEILH